MTSSPDDGIVVREVETGDETMPAGRIPGALRDRLGAEATLGVLELLDEEREEWSEQVLSTAADRFECRLTAEISGLRTDVHQSLHEGLRGVRQELATTRVETLRWSFVFWIGQVAAMAGLLSFMLRR